MTLMIPNHPEILSMTSQEIAELTGKRHDNVMADTRKMLKTLGKDALSFEGIYKDKYGRDKPCFRLDKDLTLTLVSGYNVKMRHAIVKRWQELETKPALPTTIEALQIIINDVVGLKKNTADRFDALESQIPETIPRGYATLDEICTDGVLKVFKRDTVKRILASVDNRKVRIYDAGHLTNQMVYRKAQAKDQLDKVWREATILRGTRTYQHPEVNGTFIMGKLTD